MSAVSGTVRLRTPHAPAARGPVGVAGVVAAAQAARQGGLHGSAAREACMARPPTCPRGCVAQQVGGPSRAGRGAGMRRGFRHAVRCPERTSRSRPRPRAECRSGDVGSWTRIDGRRRCASEVPSTDATQRAAPIVRRAPRAVWSAAESRPAGRTQGGDGTNSVAAVAGCTCAPERTPPPGGTDGRATALPSADADGGSVRAASSQTRPGGVRGSTRLVAVLRRPRTHPVCRSGGGPCQGCSGQRADIARGRHRGGVICATPRGTDRSGGWWRGGDDDGRSVVTAEVVHGAALLRASVRPESPAPCEAAPGAVRVVGEAGSGRGRGTPRSRPPDPSACTRTSSRRRAEAGTR